jgi:hypothetical protein
MNEMPLAPASSKQRFSLEIGESNQPEQLVWMKKGA